LSACTGMLLCIAISYGGRDEITYAVNTLIAAGKTHVTQEDISGTLYTAGIPDPDLIIRTSGEMRTSNFLLWQSAYSEYYFTEVNWPDFDAGDLAKALNSYASRQRRFGKEK
ncbi:MAG TPA: undecaprenyl diphosphate synthase family protein, partial [Bacillota bacterium]|nr:undecaprenyl diphosphate synthase family protein [Bacillota bacterium]